MSIAARPFAFPYRGRLDPAATALMVIDMQVDFLAPDGYFALKGYDPAPLRAIIPAVASLVAAARAVGMLVVWTRQGYRADLADLTPYERYRNARAGVEVGGPGPNGPLLTRGGRGFEIVPELPPAAGEPIVDKTANGAFCYTDLEHVLRWRGITHLIFTGCTTDVCVHTTLREANDRNFQCLLVEDACASGDAYAHAAAVHMTTVEGGVFGVVATAEQALAGLRAGAVSA
jgi:nicotinamidase-related amidase